MCVIVFSAIFPNHLLYSICFSPFLTFLFAVPNPTLIILPWSCLPVTSFFCEEIFTRLILNKDQTMSCWVHRQHTGNCGSIASRRLVDPLTILCFYSLENNWPKQTESHQTTRRLYLTCMHGYTHVCKNTFTEWPRVTCSPFQQLCPYLCPIHKHSTKWLNTKLWCAVQKLQPGHDREGKRLRYWSEQRRYVSIKRHAVYDISVDCWTVPGLISSCYSHIT